MTKVKDLIDVAVDNVYVNFPIDNERYELVSALAEYVKQFAHFNVGALPEVIGWQCGSHAQAFLEETMMTFVRADIACKRLNAEGHTHTAMDWNRASSAIRAITHFRHGSRGFDPSYGDLPDIVRELWRALSHALRQDRTLSTDVPKGRRYPT